ncbi:uncharacterized protein LOC117175587 [Belonocnema kinseyi]|uniref:uncharacterized protein LOC117175587 n=1 Tax=Belonocnema kinseyi TaxID=2817044 RepID=UPI00143D5A63|nr:uncharacterized protein LOC117175587 [Belonocnema kinseyi]
MLNAVPESKEKLMFSTNSITSNSDDGVLSTAIAFAKNENNGQRPARLLLDSGSQCNLITSELCDLLKLKRTPINVKIGSISDCPFEVKHKCELEISSRNSSVKIRVTCLVVPRIRSEVPKLPFDAKLLQIPSHIKLAGPHFDRPRTIEIFLGNAIFWSLICVGQIKLNNAGLLLQKTRLGWILAGPMPGLQSKLVTCNLINKINIDNQLTKFWELEECSLNKRVLSCEENACEEFFTKTVRRDGEGWFIVSIPVKDDPRKLGDSREQGQHRLFNLEKRFTKQLEIHKEYSKFIIEYIELGQMKRINCKIDATPSFYLPRHCVIRAESVSTRLRVVFDASAQTTSGMSLSDLQMVGPNIQSDLFSILIRFRKHEFIIGTDIEKIYRQVKITPEQTSLQRILWRFDSSKTIEVFEFITVTYGTAAASFLAIRCLIELASKCEKAEPTVAKIIRHDFYVDDLLTGAETIKEVISLANRLKKILATGCFNLRKWVSNSPEIISEITESQKV